MNTKEWEKVRELVKRIQEKTDTSVEMGGWYVPYDGADIGEEELAWMEKEIYTLLSSHTQEIRDQVMKLKNSKIIGIVGATKRNANFKNDGWHDALKKVLQILESNE